MQDHLGNAQMTNPALLVGQILAAFDVELPAGAQPELLE